MGEETHSSRQGKKSLNVRSYRNFFRAHNGMAKLSYSTNARRVEPCGSSDGHVDNTVKKRKKNGNTSVEPCSPKVIKDVEKEHVLDSTNARRVEPCASSDGHVDNTVKKRKKNGNTSVEPGSPRVIKDVEKEHVLDSTNARRVEPCTSGDTHTNDVVKRQKKNGNTSVEPCSPRVIIDVEKEHVSDSTNARRVEPCTSGDTHIHDVVKRQKKNGNTSVEPCSPGVIIDVEKEHVSVAQAQEPALSPKSGCSTASAQKINAENSSDKLCAEQRDLHQMLKPGMDAKLQGSSKDLAVGTEGFNVSNPKQKLIHEGSDVGGGEKKLKYINKIKRRVMKLLIRQSSEENELKVWRLESKAKLEKYFKLECAVIRSINRTEAVRVDKLKILEVNHRQKLEELESEMGSRLSSMNAKHKYERKAMEKEVKRKMNGWKSQEEDGLLDNLPTKAAEVNPAKKITSSANDREEGNCKEHGPEESHDAAAENSSTVEVATNYADDDISKSKSANQIHNVGERALESLDVQGIQFPSVVAAEEVEKITTSKNDPLSAEIETLQHVEDANEESSDSDVSKSKSAILIHNVGERALESLDVQGIQFPSVVAAEEAEQIATNKNDPLSAENQTLPQLEDVNEESADGDISKSNPAIQIHNVGERALDSLDVQGRQFPSTVAAEEVEQIATSKNDPLSAENQTLQQVEDANEETCAVRMEQHDEASSFTHLESMDSPSTKNPVVALPESQDVDVCAEMSRDIVLSSDHSDGMPCNTSEQAVCIHLPPDSTSPIDTAVSQPCSTSCGVPNILLTESSIPCRTPDAPIQEPLNRCTMNPSVVMPVSQEQATSHVILNLLNNEDVCAETSRDVLLSSNHSDGIPCNTSEQAACFLLPPDPSSPIDAAVSHPLELAQPCSTSRGVPNILLTQSSIPCPEAPIQEDHRPLNRSTMYPSIVVHVSQGQATSHAILNPLNNEDVCADMSRDVLPSSYHCDAITCNTSEQTMCRTPEVPIQENHRLLNRSVEATPQPVLDAYSPSHNSNLFRSYMPSRSFPSSLPASQEFDPLQIELERVCVEWNQVCKNHEDMALLLKSELEKKIEELGGQVRRKYESRVHEVEASFLQKKREIERNQFKVAMNINLAEAFRRKTFYYNTAPQQALGFGLTPQQVLELCRTQASASTQRRTIEDAAHNFRSLAQPQPSFANQNAATSSAAVAAHNYATFRSLAQPQPSFDNQNAATSSAAIAAHSYATFRANQNAATSSHNYATFRSLPQPQPSFANQNAETSSAAVAAHNYATFRANQNAATSSATVAAHNYATFRSLAQPQPSFANQNAATSSAAVVAHNYASFRSLAQLQPSFANQNAELSSAAVAAHNYATFRANQNAATSSAAVAAHNYATFRANQNAATSSHNYATFRSLAQPQPSFANQNAATSSAAVVAHNYASFRSLAQPQPSFANQNTATSSAAVAAYMPLPEIARNFQEWNFAEFEASVDAIGRQQQQKGIATPTGVICLSDDE